jgi:hypothetical protein
MVEGFTKRYGVHHLVRYELHESMESAIQREKRLKEWKRVWKLELIESTIRIGKICIIKLFDWIPAFAGMTRKDNRRLVKLALVPYLTLTLFPDFAEAGSCRHTQGERKDNF